MESNISSSPSPSPSPSSSSTMVASTRRPSSKRLLFDRRYGWVLDEWKDPSEEALAGGRGMFCILPLAKGLFEIASQSINFAANSAVKVLEKPDELSPQALQANLNDQLQKFISYIQQPNFNLFTTSKVDPSILSSSCLEHMHPESTDSQNG